jgi:RNA polymerase sigma-70 factor (ECF subfamily)
MDAFAPEGKAPLDTPPDHDDLSDTLLAHSASQHATAFAELYRRHVDRVYRYARSRVGNEADAQDLTAQTFTAALRGIRQFRGDGSVAAWLTSIARNLAASSYRLQRPSLPLEEHLASDAPSPEDSAIQRLRLDAILQALETLPPDHAEVIRLRIFSELSTAETAALLGKSEAAVKMTLHRALQALRRRVEADAQEILHHE